MKLESYWGVFRFSRDRQSPIQSTPLFTCPALPGSNFWQAQFAMQSLQRIGVHCYVDLIEEYR